MADYVLSCCSTADLSDEYFKKRNIPYVCFHFELGGIDYLDDCGKSVTPEEMFERMDAGEDILHLTLSTGISGTYNAACIAANELKEKYPDRKLYIVDSLAASSGFGLLVDKLADMRDAGVGIDELHAWAEDNKLRLHHWFFSTDLTYYIRGGRVSKVAGFFGTALNICPLLNVDFQGRLIPREKIHGKKKVIKRIVEKMEEFAEDGTNYSGKCFISHSACMDDAREVADLVEANFPKLSGKVEIFPIGATIGSHTGPGTVALFFWGKKRED